MAREPDFSYVNDRGRRVAGPPAFVHYVYTEKGGVQEYNDEVGQAYIEAFVKANSDIINEGLAVKARRSRLKVV